MNNKLKLCNLYALHNICDLSNPFYIEQAKQFVPGVGNPDAKIIFIGEAPGAQEENEGKPFVGRSGKLLRKTLESVGFDESNSFITNVVKFRPPANRTPLPLEIQNHIPMLNQEIDIINPIIIVTVGAIATYAILDENKLGITKIRGRKFQKREMIVIPIFHPAYILRNPSSFSIFKEDIFNIKEIYNIHVN